MNATQKTPVISTDTYSEIHPGKYLSKEVECFWKVQASHEMILPPDGTLNVIYAPYGLFITGMERIRLPKGIYLFPLNKWGVRISNYSVLYGARLKLFTATSFKHFNIEDLSLAEVYSCSDFIPFSIHSNLQQSDSLNDLVNPLSEALSQLVHLRGTVEESSSVKLNYLLMSYGKCRVEEMADQFGVSRQSLRCDFKKRFGYSIKSLASIWQFNYMLSLLSRGYALLDAILEAGYYDQAHGTNSCKRYLKISPGAILKNRRALIYALESATNRFEFKYYPH